MVGNHGQSWVMMVDPRANSWWADDPEMAYQEETCYELLKEVSDVRVYVSFSRR